MGHKRFGRDKPELVDVGEPTALQDGAVYVPYFDMQLEFDDSRARSVLGAAGITCPRLEDYFSRLIDYAEAAKWGKIAITREEAREQFVGTPA
jgi:hypothetical protein